MAHPYGPDPDQKHPIPDHPRVCFIKDCIKAPNIVVGDYSYYDDPIDPEGFERNVLYNYGNDRLIIGKFCAIATGVKFIMSGANHKLDGISPIHFLSLAMVGKVKWSKFSIFPVEAILS